MSDNGDIKKAIRLLSGIEDKEIYSIICTVKSVDLTNKTCYCVPLRGDADLQSVSLILDKKVGFMIIPTIGSKVMVTMQNDESGYIGMFSEVDFIYLNGTSYGGLVKVMDLVTRLNTIENDINTLKTIFSSWTPVANDGGAALKLSSVSWSVASLTPTTQANIENTYIKHGNGN